jgi:hypothetical protein
MITLTDPLDIPTTHKDFKSWMLSAGNKIEELDQKRDDITESYFRNGDDERRDQKLFDLKWEILELKITIRAVMSLWGQLKAEMD